MFPRLSKWKYKLNILYKQFNLVKYLKLWHSRIMKIFAEVYPTFTVAF